MNSRKRQEMDDNIEFLRGQFSELNQQIKLPHSLDSEMLRYKLENLDLSETKTVKKRDIWVKPLLGLAACFVIVFGSFYALRSPTGSAAPMASPDQAASGEVQEKALEAASQETPTPMLAQSEAENAGGAVYADSYTQLRDAVFLMNGGYDAYGRAMLFSAQDGTEAGIPQEEPVAEAAPEIAQDQIAQAEEAPRASAKAGFSSAAGAGFSTTNLQETGVDEADIVKTDGRYLYSYVQKNTTTRHPTIFIIDSQDMDVESKIELENTDVNEFYVSGDRLVAVGYSYNVIPYAALPKETIVNATDDSVYNGILEKAGSAEEKRIAADAAAPGGDYANTTVGAVVYDISNRSEPKEVKTFLQDGNYVSSRLMDGVLYLVSNRYVYPAFDRKNTLMAEMVPIVYDSASKAARLIAPEKIAIAPGAQAAGYAVVSALDVNSGQSDTQAVLGGSEGVYMSADSLYAYYTVNKRVISAKGSYQSTGIIKLNVDKTKLTLKNTTTVEGYVDGQFSFGEYKGNLRVATTVELAEGTSGNNLYVLDGDMRQIGALEGLAPGERIYSVRYRDEMAYIVTFRQTDPLFAVDLSDPRNPKLLGQLKIPGFSEYLHPVDKDTLLGIGRSADGQGVTDGLKLSLFDVSDPVNPRELSVYNLGGAGSDSEALANHKAVLFALDRGLVGFPASVVNPQGPGSEGAYFIFSFDRDKGFELEKSITHESADKYGGFGNVSRGLYIGDTLYTFSPEKVVSFDFDTFAQKDTVLLK